MENEIVHKIEHLCGRIIVKELKILLGEKHLYQSVYISRDELKVGIQDELEKARLTTVTTEIQTIVDTLLDARWEPSDPDNRRLPFSGHNIEPLESVSFRLVSVKTFCGNCSELNPMNLKTTSDSLSGIWDETGPLIHKWRSIYTFAFQCQNCRTGMEVFMVARNRDKLTLVGRSPMEQVNVPKYIPHGQKKYYSGAVIAFNSGQTLAALFMLRTFIEQFTRASIFSSSNGHIDQMLDEYMATLPKDFKDRFPSLKQVYGELSEAIHRADESEPLFVESHERINNHFDARRLFGIRS